MRILDLYCCAGGGAVGYARAGWEVFGVDITPQPNYPMPFHQGSAIDVLETLIDGYRVTFAQPDGGTVQLGLMDFDAIHASPPCQRYTAGNRVISSQNRNPHPDLVGPTRELLHRSELPYVIENVVGAPLFDPTMLCGRQFDLTAVDDDGTVLQLDRHRLFETNWTLRSPATCLPHDKSVQVAGSYGGARRDKLEARHVRHGGYVPSYEVQQRLLDIDWMKERELYQALPPAYTQHIGARLAELVSAWADVLR